MVENAIGLTKLRLLALLDEIVNSKRIPLHSISKIFVNIENSNQQSQPISLRVNIDVQDLNLNLSFRVRSSQSQKNHAVNYLNEWK
jgi:hypothetical protein